MDQRGTGLSTPISAETLELCGGTQQQADYLKLFRADNIVRDCEAIRKFLLKDYPSESRKWTVFGQSFGGFCAFTYLSKYPEGLKEVFVSGGVPPIGQSPDDVYRATFRQVCVESFEFYEILMMSTLSTYVTHQITLTLSSYRCASEIRPTMKNSPKTCEPFTM